MLPNLRSHLLCESEQTIPQDLLYSIVTLSGPRYWFFFVNSFQDMKMSLTKRRGPVEESPHVCMYIMWTGFTVGFDPYWSSKFNPGVSDIVALPGNTVCQCFCKG